MIKIRGYKLENVNGLNRSLAKSMILEFYKKSNDSKYRSNNYAIIIRRKKNFGFTGALISNHTKKKYKFEYNYINNTFVID